MSALRLRSIRKNFGSTVAVDDVTLDVADQKFLVLLGPSGCGKTTIMRLIAGLETLTAGEIWIGSKCMNRELPRDRDVAMVFQSYALYPHMSVYENIEYPLRVRKMPIKQRRAAALEAARIVELEALLDRLPRQLSGGQRQRVALARAIVRRPQVFLMDEPLSNLDARLRVKMRSELKHLHHISVHELPVWRVLGRFFSCRRDKCAGNWPREPQGC
jgi:multiple sugar transport system ATP-binding protein